MSSSLDSTEKCNLIPELCEGWLELESDPGLFTRLVQHLGVRGVQVEEIYDLSQKPLIEERGETLGFIFLFKWNVEERSRRLRVRNRAALQQNLASVTSKLLSDLDVEELENVVNLMECSGGRSLNEEETANFNLFFAYQIVPNSCATHSLLSVLLNVREDSPIDDPDQNESLLESTSFRIGKHLHDFKDFSVNMCAESRGMAIGNSGHFAHIHNMHATSRSLLESREDTCTSSSSTCFLTGPDSSGSGSGGLCVDRAISSTDQSSSCESSIISESGIGGSNIHTSSTTHGSNNSSKNDSFHFVSYVPLHGRLFELDGLKRNPIDHGPILPTEDWTVKFSRVIAQRLDLDTGGKEDDIRFALMAVIPDRRTKLAKQLKDIHSNWKCLVDHLNSYVKLQADELQEVYGIEEEGGGGGDEGDDDVKMVENFDWCSKEFQLLKQAFDLIPQIEDFHDVMVSDNPFMCDKLLDTHDYSLPPATSPQFRHQLKRKRPQLDKYSVGVEWKGVAVEKREGDFTDTNPAFKSLTPREKLNLLYTLESEFRSTKCRLGEEHEKRDKNELEHQRRTHDYTSFISQFVQCLAESGTLTDILINEYKILGKNGGVLPISNTSATTSKSNTKHEVHPTSRKINNKRGVVVSGGRRSNNRLPNRSNRQKFKKIEDD